MTGNASTHAVGMSAANEPKSPTPMGGASVSEVLAGGLPTVALSIMQPWAGLIVNGLKDIENRSWPTRFRGDFLIHAGLKLDGDAMDSVDAGMHPVKFLDDLEGHHGLLYPRGGIVGIAEIVDCVTSSASPWFVGEYGFVLRNARPIEFRPCKGALGFFTPDYEAQYAQPKAREPKAQRVVAVETPEPDLFAIPTKGGEA